MKTELDLYRSLKSKDFPTVPTTEDAAVAKKVLYPSFVDTYFKKAGAMVKRDADVDVVDGNVLGNGRGTSLFDKVNAMSGGWRDFPIPEGTVIPDSLKIRYTHYNKRFDADHYQIECRAHKMEQAAFMGALDNLTRNAIVRAVALAK